MPTLKRQMVSLSLVLQEKNPQQDGNENVKETIGNNFARASRFFVHFLPFLHENA